MKPIRNSAKAVIVEDRRLLCIQKEDEQGGYLILPGGGQERQEPLRDTLRRECLEEIGAEVEIGDLRFVREYISNNHEFAHEEPDLHNIDFMFACALAPGARIGNGSMPDEGQLGVVWVPLADLERERLYPLSLARALAAGEWDGVPVYLGDVN
ncbi:MAG TPA: NUDIX domain-containing protein [Thermomicrobiales bacterium]|nr:NUDIX domain-containing protein [Thermomicrobiales bacterium]